MEKRDTTEFQKWLAKYKNTEWDIIKCRKMQSMTITESESTFGIATISVCGFQNNDVITLGSNIKQHYDESREDYYKLVYDILMVCGELMDSVNEILADEAAWTGGYFQKKFMEWGQEKLKK